MAVLQRSETLVRYRLRDPAVISEKNSIGQSALHLYGDWALGTELLLEAGFACDQIDETHYLPLNYAVSMQGSAAAAFSLLQNGSPLTCCDEPHAWNSILDCELDRETRLSSQWPLSPILACLIDTIKHPRESLAALAEAYLSRSVLDDLYTFGTAIDDTRVHRTWEALRGIEVRIPASLRTQGVSVYHRVRSKYLATHLYDMGFKCLDEYDRDGKPPLASLAYRCDDPSDTSDFIEELFDLAKWFFLQGANPLRSFRDHDICALHVAARYGAIRITKIEEFTQQRLISRFTGDYFNAYWIDPVVLRNLTSNSYPYSVRVLNPLTSLFLQNAGRDRYDSCRCGCSRHGCTATTKLLVGITEISKDFHYFHSSLQLYEIAVLLYDWYRAIVAVGLSRSNVRAEVQRFIAFEKLDLKHTCCRLDSYHGLDVFNTIRLSDRDADEIREEQDELLGQLEIMLQQPGSDWWNLPSILDILLEVDSTMPPPTLKGANLWLVQRVFGLDEEACEETRLAGDISEEEFWESEWRIPEIAEGLESWEIPERCGGDQWVAEAKSMPKAYQEQVLGQDYIAFRS